jgi:hypothetical protein
MSPNFSLDIQDKSWSPVILFQSVFGLIKRRNSVEISTVRNEGPTLISKTIRDYTRRGQFFGFSTGLTGFKNRKIRRDLQNSDRATINQ